MEDVKDQDKKDEEENKQDKVEENINKKENEKEEEKEGDKKEDEKEEKKEDNKDEEKKEDEIEIDEKTRKKLEKEEKKKKKKEKEKEEKEKKKKEKEEKKKKKLEKEKEEKEKKKEEKEKKKKEKEEKKKEKEEKKKEEKEKKVFDKMNILYSIDEENKKCVDCGAENPTKVSINNGVIICNNCSKEHEELGHDISFIKNIEDDFDEFLINFIVMGSNTKFKRFLAEEQIDSSLPIKSKYKTSALYFYRKNLKAKVEGKIELKKDYQDANEIIEKEDDNIFPEFNQQYIIKNQILRRGTLIVPNKFSFKNIFNRVFQRNAKKRRGRSSEKARKKNKSINLHEIDMNKTSPPELAEDNKELNLIESSRAFKEEEEKKDEKKEDKKENKKEDKKEDKKEEKEEK